jgi:hypothetical protein
MGPSSGWKVNDLPLPDRATAISSLLRVLSHISYCPSHLQILSTSSNMGDFPDRHSQTSNTERESPGSQEIPLSQALCGYETMTKTKNEMQQLKTSNIRRKIKPRILPRSLTPNFDYRRTSPGHHAKCTIPSRLTM